MLPRKTCCLQKYVQSGDLLKYQVYSQESRYSNNTNGIEWVARSIVWPSLPLKTGCNSLSLNRNGYSVDIIAEGRSKFHDFVGWETFDASALRDRGVKEFHVSKYISQISQIEKWIFLVFTVSVHFSGGRRPRRACPTASRDLGPTLRRWVIRTITLKFATNRKPCLIF